MEREIIETSDEILSECCCATLYNFNDGIGICSKCHDWAGVIEDDANEEKKDDNG